MRFIAKILVLSVSVSVTFAYAQTLPTFQHIIVLIQENRTPDNLFGSNPTFEPGVDLQQPSTVQWCLGACFDPGHTHSDWENEFQQPKQTCPGRGYPDGCTTITTYCNGEVVGSQLPVPTCPQQTYVSGTYDNSVVAPYFDIANKYGFANYFFQTNQGPSMPAHLFLFSGTSAPTGTPPQEGALNFFQAENPPGGVNNSNGDTACTAPPAQTVQLIDQNGVEDHNNSQYKIFPCFSHNSLPTLLDAARPSITWKYYTNQPSPTAHNNIWNAPAAIHDICQPLDGSQTMCTGSDYVNDVVVNNTAQILLDLGAVANTSQCTLRQVSWVIPNGDRSDHPGFGKNQNDSHQIEGGPAWVADIINTLGNDPQHCGYWNNTAVLVVWDDWGGYWDHVSPYEVLINDPAHSLHCDPTTTFGCGYVSGFRVPFLVVSA